MGNWHRQDILAAVRKRGTSLSSLSRSFGLHPGVLRVALDRKVPRYNQIIAEFLEKRRHDIWPEWYGPDDEPVQKTPYERRSERSAA
jgi:Ner family transcriptional regulator